MCLQVLIITEVWKQAEFVLGTYSMCKTKCKLLSSYFFAVSLQSVVRIFVETFVDSLLWKIVQVFPFVYKARTNLLSSNEQMSEVFQKKALSRFFVSWLPVAYFWIMTFLACVQLKRCKLLDSRQVTSEGWYN